MLRTSFGILVLGLLALAPRAAAQDSVRRDVKLPSGAMATRTCASWQGEGVVILAADPRGAGANGKAYFEKLAKAMEHRLDFVSPDTASAFVVAYAARVLKDGEVVSVQVIRSSGSQGFDMATRRAASFTAKDMNLVPMPEGMPDSLAVLLSFGRRPDGSSYLVQHLRCPAFALPDNPAPEYPLAATIIRSRYHVDVRYLVDTTGHVDSASVELLDEAAEAFIQASYAWLAKLRYLPEVFDDELQAQRITRTIIFVAPGDTLRESP